MRTCICSNLVCLVRSISPRWQNPSLLATSNKIIKLWDVPTDKLIAASEVIRKKVSFLAFRPESTALASGNIDVTVKLWGVSMAKLQVTLHSSSKVD